VAEAAPRREPHNRRKKQLLRWATVDARLALKPGCEALTVTLSNAFGGCGT
jgi:hypothetical protein